MPLHSVTFWAESGSSVKIAELRTATELYITPGYYTITMSSLRRKECSYTGALPPTLYRVMGKTLLPANTMSQKKQNCGTVNTQDLQMLLRP